MAKPKKKPKAKPKGASAPRAAAPTTVNLRFENTRPTMATPKKNEPDPGKPRRKKRRNGGMTFGQAALKAVGGAAAMFGSGLLNIVGIAKLPASPVTNIGLGLASLGIGAAVATKYPVVGVGVAAGGAAPYVLPVAAAMLEPSTAAAAQTAKGLAGAMRAVGMGSGRGWRELNRYPGRRVGAVRMGSVAVD